MNKNLVGNELEGECIPVDDFEKIPACKKLAPSISPKKYCSIVENEDVCKGESGNECCKWEILPCKGVTCPGNAKCKVTSGTSYKCECNPGWTGTSCKTQMPCPVKGGRGTCLYKTKMCVGGDKICGLNQKAGEIRQCLNDEDGYYIRHTPKGSGSSTKTPVSKGIKCDKNYIPYCYPVNPSPSAYIIFGCKDLCKEVDCGSHGTCVNGRCVCEPGWKGTSCTIQPPPKPSPPKPSPPPPTKNKKKKLSAGAIVGIVFGCIAAILILAFLIIHHKRKN